jgi:ferredoxin
MPGVLYAEVAAAVRATGMRARGGFVPSSDDRVPVQPGGAATRCVVVIGNIGGEMWPAFRAGERDVRDPLDDWTRRQLRPIADRLGAGFVHPSDEPFQPFQRWAQRADDVWQSPIGLLIHPDHGLWHAYRGAFLFPFELDGLPPVGQRSSPCLTCAGQPCLSTCPVGAFTLEGYDAEACRGHVHSRAEPVCAEHGCAARLACPVGTGDRYESDQMQFHMRAFAGT